MTLIFQSPQLSEKTAREKQKAEVCHRIAVMVATQVLELVKVGAPAVTRQNIQSLRGGDDNKLLQTIMQLVRDVTWPIIEPAVAGVKTDLAPTVTGMDAQGRECRAEKDAELMLAWSHSGNAYDQLAAAASKVKKARKNGKLDPKR